MIASTPDTKIAKIFETIILNRTDHWKELLLQGDLDTFEQELQSLLQQLYGAIMRQLLNEVGSSLAFKNNFKSWH